MSKSRDSVDAIAQAIREDDEARQKLAEAVVEQMDIDDSMPEGQGAQAHRRDVLKTLGLLGTGAAAGALGGTAATQQASAADTSVGQLGTAGNPLDITLDEIKDDGGDVVADIDDTGDVDFKRGIASPAVTTKHTATETASVSESLRHDLSQNNPHSPVGPELSGPPTFKAFEGQGQLATASDFQSATGDTTNFVADGFIRRDPHNNRYVVPCEVSTSSALKIGYLEGETLSDLSPSATYAQTAGGADIEASWGYIETFFGDWYLVPGDGKIYRQDTPLDMQGWDEVGNRGAGFTAAQDVIFWRQNGRYWKAGADDTTGGGADEIKFLYSDKTEGTLDGQSWTEASWSPLPGGDGTAKQAPAGRPWQLREGHLIIHYQDERDSPVRVSQFAYQLDTNSVTETETGASPVLDGWLMPNAQSSTAHTLDPIFHDGFGAPVAVMDYKESTDGDWGLGLVTLSGQKPVQAKLTKTSDQTISSSEEIITWDGQTQNTWGAAEPSNNQFVVPGTGVYEVSATITLADHDPDCQLIAKWQVNGNDARESVEKISPGSGFEVTVNPSFRRRLSESDTLKLAATVNGSADNTISGAGSDARQASLTRVSGF
jgi:hypothetical protein